MNLYEEIHYQVEKEVDALRAELHHSDPRGELTLEEIQKLVAAASSKLPQDAKSEVSWIENAIPRLEEKQKKPKEEEEKDDPEDKDRIDKTIQDLMDSIKPDDPEANSWYEFLKNLRDSYNEASDPHRSRGGLIWDLIWDARALALGGIPGLLSHIVKRTLVRWGVAGLKEILPYVIAGRMIDAAKRDIEEFINSNDTVVLNFLEEINANEGRGIRERKAINDRLDDVLHQLANIVSQNQDLAAALQACCAALTLRTQQLNTTLRDVNDTVQTLPAKLDAIGSNKPGLLVAMDVLSNQAVLLDKVNGLRGLL